LSKSSPPCTSNRGYDCSRNGISQRPIKRWSPTTGEAQLLGIDEIALAEFEIMLEDRFLTGQTVTAVI
jgi:hypothetical protein